MNRIDQLFNTTTQGILSIYYPAGYPNMEDTLPIAQELQAQGVNMIEIGIPFSDPLADGAVIQQAATRALGNGMTLQRLFTQLQSLREQVSIPVVLMGYLNPIMQFGFEAFCKACRKVGVDGVIIPDLPYQEYMDHYKDLAEQYDVKVIMLITPETSVERIRMIDAHSSGFIYMVSTAATTGAQSSYSEETQAYFTRVAQMNLKHPCLIGFGISNAITYDAAVSKARGAIVGSYFVKLLETSASIPEAVSQLLKTLKPQF